jgi:hypothetical protein
VHHHHQPRIISAASLSSVSVCALRMITIACYVWTTDTSASLDHLHLSASSRHHARLVSVAPRSITLLSPSITLPPFSSSSCVLPPSSIRAVPVNPQDSSQVLWCWCESVSMRNRCGTSVVECGQEVRRLRLVHWRSSDSWEGQAVRWCAAGISCDDTWS